MALYTFRITLADQLLLGAVPNRDSQPLNEIAIGTEMEVPSRKKLVQPSYVSFETQTKGCDHLPQYREKIESCRQKDCKKR